MRSSASRHLVVAALAVLLPAAAEAGTPSRLLLLVSPTREISTDSLLLALSTQLARYEIDTQRQLWRPPSIAGARLRLARQLAGAASADFAVFYELRGPRRQVAVELVDLRRDAFWSRSLALGDAGFGIERSMAAAVVTLLQSRLGQVAKPRPTSRPVASSRPTPRRPRLPPPPPRPWLQLGLGYRLAALGAQLRHGPEVLVAARGRAWELALDLSVGLPDHEVDGALSWSRWALSLGAALLWVPRLAPRFDLQLGGRTALTWVDAQGTTAASGTAVSARSTLWELHLGGLAGIAWWLRPRWALLLALRVDWLPIGHRLLLAEQEVARSGGVEVSATLQLRVGIF